MPKPTRSLLHGFKAAVFLIAGALASAASAVPFSAVGEVYTATGTSGTATDSPSYAGAVVYRYAVAAEQAQYPDGITPTAINAASGGNPANYVMDAGSQFLASINAGDTLVAVAESRKGRFGWAGLNHVYFDRHVVTPTEATNTVLLFTAGNQVTIPAPTLVTATSSTVQLEWTGMSDPSGVISSYSIYRATFAPPTATDTLSVPYLLGQTAIHTGGTVGFIDTTVAPNTTYYYTIAPNLKWTGGSNIGVGANPNKPYYTTFGQSLALTTTTTLSPALLSGTWNVPVGATLGQVFTVSFTVSNTGDLATAGNVSASASPIVSGSGSAVLQSGPTPVGVTLGAHSSVVFQYTYSATGQGLVSFSATAQDGVSVSVTAGSSATSLAPGANLSNFVTINRDLIYVAPSFATVTSVMVVMTVTNTGGTTAVGVSPSTNIFLNVTKGLGPLVSLVSGPATPQNITPGATASFTWTYSGIAGGQMNFYVGATGTDQNTSLAVNVTGTSTSTLTVAEDELDLNMSMPNLSAPFLNYSQGEPITITVNVANLGSIGTALNASVTARLAPLRYGAVIQGSPSASVLSLPTPASVDIAPFTSADFTSTFNAAGSGIFRIGAHALASSSAGVMFADSETYDGGALGSFLTVVSPAAISVTALTASASQVTVGQVITVSMTVVDHGQDTVTALVPTVAANLSGGAALTGLSSPAGTFTLQGRGLGAGPNPAQTFTWTFSAASAGTVSFSGWAVGRDYNWANHGVTFTVSTLGFTGPGLTIFNPALLTQSVTGVMPYSVTQGQIFTAVLSVSNTSNGATANNMVPSPSVAAVPAFPIYQISTPSPSNATLTAGANALFTWTYSAGGTGFLSFSYTVSAIDAVSGLTVTAGPLNRTVTVQAPATLSASLTAPSAIASVGGKFTLHLSVTNTGGASALVLPPTWSESPPGSASIYSVAPSSKVLGGSQAQVFTYVYDALSTNNVTFSGSVVGTDLNTNSAISSNSTNTLVSLVNPAALTASFLAGYPTLVSTGQVITVQVRVNNTAAVPGATALAARPNTVLQVGSGGFALGSGPTPASQDIPAFSQFDFEFTYTATAAGTVVFSTFALGTDSNTNSLVSSAFTSSSSITVQPAGALAASLTVTPTLLTPSSPVYAYLTVTNTGGTTVNSVAPSLTFAPGTLTQFSPAPSTVTLSAGASHTFSWGFSPAGTGNYVFTATAAGADAISALAVNSSQALAAASVRSPAALASSFFFFPAVASTSQKVTLHMTVTNSGEADAVGTAPIQSNGSTWFAKLGTSNPVVLDSGPLPASQTVPGLGSRVFTFVYTVNGAGSVAFSGSARGTDAILGAEIEGLANASNFIQVENIAALSSAISSSPTAVNLGQLVTVTMLVANNGGATASGVKPRLPLVLLGSGGALQVNGPTPASANLTPTASQVFTFTYSATGLGTVSFSSYATGTDVNSGFTIQSTQNISNETVVRNDPLLSATFALFPASVNVGQRITAVLSVSNSGQGNANNVAPQTNDLLSVLSGTAALSLISLPAPASLPSLAPGATAVFTWVYQPAAPALSVSATGPWAWIL